MRAESSPKDKKPAPFAWNGLSLVCKLFDFALRINAKRQSDETSQNPSR